MGIPKIRTILDTILCKHICQVMITIPDMWVLQIVHIEAGHNLCRAILLQMLQCLLKMFQRINTRYRNNSESCKTVDYISLERTFCQQNRLCGLTNSMGPPLSLATIPFTDTGNPAKLTLPDIVKSDLKSLDLSIRVSLE